MLLKAVLFQLLFSFSVFATATVECPATEWLIEPQFNKNGDLIAVIKSVCAFPIEKLNSISKIYTKFKNNIESESRYIIHGVPHFVDDGKFIGVKYFLTEQLPEDEDSLKVDSDLVIAHQNEETLHYESRSKKVTGKGNGAYLKEVAFSFHLKISKSSGNAEIVNSILLERPWYAPQFIFKEVASKKITSKFIKQRNNFIDETFKK